MSNSIVQYTTKKRHNLSEYIKTGLLILLIAGHSIKKDV